MRFAQILILIGCFAFCSCAANHDPKKSARPALPPEISFNLNAGRGNSLFVMLRLGDGPELPFLLDTGSETTILDKSLEPKLGKRLRTEEIPYGWLGKSTVGIYHAPALYLGNTRLLTGDQVWADDISRTSRPANGRLMGILGMDCLRHYCLQMDFVDRKIRFLDPDVLDVKTLGKPYPLRLKSGQFFVLQNLLGAPDEKTLLDTADYNDGALSAKAFERELQRQKVDGISEDRNKDGISGREAMFPQGVFGGETYTNILLADTSHSSDPAMNIVGLRFLARHLVTLNFPGRIMYLQLRTNGPLAVWQNPDSNFAATKAATDFLFSLKKAGHVPGWTKAETGDLAETPHEDNGNTYPMSRTFNATKAGDTFVYHYSLIHLSPDSPWKLQKAWRTDATGKTIDEYPIP